MGSNCASLVVGVLFCYEGDYVLLLFNNKQSDVIMAFDITLRYII